MEREFNAAYRRVIPRRQQTNAIDRVSPALSPTRTLAKWVFPKLPIMTLNVPIKPDSRRDRLSGGRSQLPGVGSSIRSTPSPLIIHIWREGVEAVPHDVESNFCGAKRHTAKGDAYHRAIATTWIEPFRTPPAFPNQSLSMAQAVDVNYPINQVQAISPRRRWVMAIFAEGRQGVEEVAIPRRWADPRSLRASVRRYGRQWKVSLYSRRGAIAANAGRSLQSLLIRRLPQFPPNGVEPGSD